jgi:hypothetical protein
MNRVLDFPLAASAFAFLMFWLSAIAGAFCARNLRPLDDNERGDFGVVQAATLTMLGLLIGFTFSMATNRYEQRKNYEEAEANAIGTEYVRADLLPTADATRTHDLLEKYLDLRVLFYNTTDATHLQEIDFRTTQLQNGLWSAVRAPATAQPTPVAALVVAGMNDVLNSQGYTQAAWWNRIPIESWILLVALAVGCNLLIGYGAHRTSLLFVILPLAVSLSFFLIADIDSPRGGLIRVKAQNLLSLSQTLHKH